MCRLSRELIPALRLSFEAWLDVAGQDMPLADGGAGRRIDASSNVRFAPPRAVVPELHRARIVFVNFRLAKRVLFGNISPPLVPKRAQFGCLTLVVASFSLISQCTRRAHAVF
jgi:hypothetical protein